MIESEKDIPWREDPGVKLLDIHELARLAQDGVLSVDAGARIISSALQGAGCGWLLMVRM